MKTKIISALVLSSILFGIFGENPVDDRIESMNKSSTGNCDCVPDFLCQAGRGLIDIHGGSDDICSSYRHVCCYPQYKVAILPTELKKGCGYRNVDGVGFKIMEYSNEAQFGEFPWMVAILAEEFNAATNKTMDVYKCGGALIHPQVILTAAHCIAKREKKYKVRAGEWDTQTTNEHFPHQHRFVKNIVIHEDFISTILSNDVALLFLEGPFDIMENVNTLCLPEQNLELKSGIRCFVSGWGKDVFEKEGKYQVILRKVDLPIVEHATCQNKLKTTSIGKYFELDKSFVCAGGEEGKDTCKGDGGSPLVCPIPGQHNRYQHIGMVAWGIGCELPGVYVNVGYFRHWIDNEMVAHNFDSSYYKP